uniref:Methyltransferase type 11 domain-containing protein n=1 Tax=Vitrella brassicaformis TaxID=1169539 RepID=A0A7S1JK81_9ALVE
MDVCLLSCVHQCGQDSTRNVQTMLKEIFRVLKPSGQYVCVTYGQPSYRMTYLQRPELGWKVDIKTVQKQTMAVSANIQADEKDNVHYIYVCTKTAEGEHKIPMDSENSPTEEVVA